MCITLSRSFYPSTSSTSSVPADSSSYERDISIQALRSLTTRQRLYIANTCSKEIRQCNAMPMHSFVCSYRLTALVFSCVSFMSFRIPRQQEKPRKARDQPRATASSRLIACTRILLHKSKIWAFICDDCVRRNRQNKS